MLLMCLSGFACSRPAGTSRPVPPPETAAKAESTSTGSSHEAVAVFAGGCFWCTEAAFAELKGVTDVESGYAGGTKNDADYHKVSTGTTGHAEVIRISFDPSQITFGDLLEVFFKVHDPTQLNRQGPDTGSQYRSAVFYASDEQRQAAQAYIKQLTDAKAFDKPIVTTLEPLTAFYPAEAYHQDYVKHNPNQGYIKAYALPKVEKVRKEFSDRVK